MNKAFAIVLSISWAAGACDGTPAAMPDAKPLPGADAPPLSPDAPAVKPPCNPVAIAADAAWYGDNVAHLTGWLDSAGCASASYDPAHPPVALFDWDNTISKNDFGDAITFWMIANAKVLQPPGQDWKATSPFMTTEAATALSAACGTTVAAGQPLPTDTNAACADEMLSIYVDGVTRTGAAAFAGANYRRLEPTYAWTAQIFGGGGYTHEDIQAFALAAIAPQLVAAEGKTQTIGTTAGLNGWLRIYPQIKSLIAATRSRGYDVWIITASPQDVIAAVAPMVGISADHVVGIRSRTDAGGKLTYGFEGCGPVADDSDALIPYIEGKRCWINKVVFGDTSAAAIDRRPDGARQVFAAGDSNTDVEFLRDATYKLVINRNKKELMCNAYNNAADSWRVNPTFIGGKHKAADYPCPTTACFDANGAAAACTDELGHPIPVQADGVFLP
jgi:phosphoserine phosphatase